MSYAKHFFDETKPLAKPKIVCIEEDWELLCHVFPEPGFRSYFCGHIINKLATQLKANGVTDYFERSRRPELADLPRFLSNIILVRKEGESNGRCGVGGSCDEASYCQRVPAGDALLAVRETKEGQVFVRRESGQEAGPKVA